MEIVFGVGYASELKGRALLNLGVFIQQDKFRCASLGPNMVVLLEGWTLLFYLFFSLNPVPTTLHFFEEN